MAARLGARATDAVHADGSALDFGPERDVNEMMKTSTSGAGETPERQCACPHCSGGAATRGERGQRVRVTLPISGWSCGGAEAQIVEAALAKVPGVVHAYVNPATEMAYADYDSCACDAEALRRAVAAVGLRAGVPGFR